MARKRKIKSSDGWGDPSGNVKTLVGMSVLRESDLRESETRRLESMMNADSRRVDELMKLRAEYAGQLSIAEAKRIDAIRAVDINAVHVANERATAQAAVLANQVSASAETLRALVAATATTTAQQLAQLTTQLTDRLASLEKSQYESKGTGSGRRDMGGWIVGGIMTLIAVAGYIVPLLK